jgi:hypothetical protein
VDDPLCASTAVVEPPETRGPAAIRRLDVVAIQMRGSTDPKRREM